MKSESSKKILIAGIGNIFLADDAFGSEVARRLGQEKWPSCVRVVDFGIRGIDLVYALLEHPDLTILIDSTSRGQTPGTLYTIEPDISELDIDQQEVALLEGHSLDPVKVLRTVVAMGGTCPRLLLVGCEPADLGGEEGAMGLSLPVSEAVEEACRIVRRLTEEFLAADSPCISPAGEL